MRHAVLTVILFFSLFTPAQAQIVLNGNLQEDSGKPVPNTKINVAAGPSDTTDSKGQFSIKLSRDFIEGERVIIQVLKKDWWINHPLDGEWNLPNLKYQNVHTTKVIIVPKGYKKLWTHERIEKHIALLSDELAKVKKEGDKPKPIDFSRYLREWAAKYGFTPDEVKEEFDRWAKEAEGSGDKRKRCLSNFYQKKFELASVCFDEAALDEEAELNRLQERVWLNSLSVYANWKDSGNSLNNLYRFEDALEKYERAQKVVANKEDFRKEWAEIKILLANVKAEIGIRAEAEKGNRYLEEAKQAYLQALEVYTRKELPQTWAMTQNNLGVALVDQGIRTGGEEGTRLLAQAVQAYQNALEVRTRKELPQDWAMTQNNLGNALREQGTRAAGEEGTRLLAQAVQAYQNALEVRTRKELPQDWAMTQNNLGNAYEALKDWPNAATCFADVLKVYPDYEMAYRKGNYLYHELLFDFSKVFELNKKWIAGHPDDLTAHVEFAEKQFTNTRFVACEETLAFLLSNGQVQPRQIIALRSIEIANLAALNKDDQIPAKMEILYNAIANEPEDLKLSWSFLGIKYFIRQNKNLATHRESLLQLFDALEKERRQAILSALQDVRLKFKAKTK